MTHCCQPVAPACQAVGAGWFNWLLLMELSWNQQRHWLIAGTRVAGGSILRWLLQLDVIYRVFLLLFARTVIELVTHNHCNGKDLPTVAV